MAPAQLELPGAVVNTYWKVPTMSDPRTPLPAPGSDPVLRAVHELRAEIDALRAALAEEVTTRRLVVADPDGFARVRITAAGDHGHVVVRTRPTGGAGDGAPTQADLFALDAEPDDPADAPSVGLDLTRHGDPATRLALPTALPADPPPGHRFLDPGPR